MRSCPPHAALGLENFMQSMLEYGQEWLRNYVGLLRSERQAGRPNVRLPCGAGPKGTGATGEWLCFGAWAGSTLR